MYGCCYVLEGLLCYWFMVSAFNSSLISDFCGLGEFRFVVLVVEDAGVLLGGLICNLDGMGAFMLLILILCLYVRF